MSDDRRMTLCLDFDGVVHQYNSPWVGACVISDDVTEGFFEWAVEAFKEFDLVIYSARSKEPGAKEAMSKWILDQLEKWRQKTGENPLISFKFASEKPKAFLYIDDRAHCFDGDWSKLTPAAIRLFKPWNKRDPQALAVRAREVKNDLPAIREFAADNIAEFDEMKACVYLEALALEVETLRAIIAIQWSRN
jgi:hypothetical protein